MDKQAPRLLQLLVINSTERPLTKTERTEAIQLMGLGNGPDGKKCFLCGSEGVGGCDICADHAYYAMVTRK